MSEPNPSLSASEFWVDLPEQDSYVQSLARHLVRDEARAEDLAQDAWLRLLNEPREKLALPRAWLRQVLRRLAITGFRQQATQNAIERDYMRAPRPASPAEMLERKETSVALALALRALPRAQCQVLLLRYYEDLAPREIAEYLGISAETVHTRLRRALAQLREHFDTSKGHQRSSLAGLALCWRTCRLPVSASLPSLPLVAGLLACGLLLSLLAISPWRSLPAPSGLQAVTELASVTTEPLADASASSLARVALTHTPAAEEELALSTLRLRCVAAGSRAAGANQVIDLERKDGEQAQRYSLTTDAQGEAEIELCNGLWQLSSARLSPRHIALAAGERKELLLELPAQVSVRGRIRDRHGAGVANAELYVSYALQPERTALRAHSDELGEFELDAPAQAWLRVEAAGMRATDWVYLYDSQTANLPDSGLEIVLEPACEAARCRVLDAAGRPVAGARVLPSLSLAGFVWRSKNERLTHPLLRPGARFTDEQGECALGDLLPHSYELWVEAEGCAPKHLALDPDFLAKAQTALEVQLERGRSLHGSLCFSHGAAAEGAQISVRVGGSEYAWRTSADARGKFAFDGLPASELLLQATTSWMGSTYSAQAQFEATAQGSLVWYAELAASEPCSAAIVDARGEPLAGLWVSIRARSPEHEDWLPNPNPTQLHWRKTDSMGRVEFPRSGQARQWIDVWQDSGETLDHLHSLEIKPSAAGQLRIEVAQERAAIQGVFQAAIQPGEASARLWIHHPAWLQAEPLDHDSESGCFYRADLAPGRYVLFAWQVGRTPQRVATVELDRVLLARLDPIHLAAAGGLQVHFSSEHAQKYAGLVVAIHERGKGGKARARPLAFRVLSDATNQVEFGDIAAGDFVLALGGERRALELYPVQVQPNSTTHFEVPYLPCIAGELHVLGRDLAPQSRTLELQVTDNQGQTRLRSLHTLTVDSSGSAFLKIPSELPPGCYRAELFARGNGLRGAVDFVVGGSTEGQTLAVLELHESTLQRAAAAQ